jgi:bifunctional DNA-binding transcriptional regulator/antitoxin component of YhaV-PrlF toxin-antitoxin module
MITSTLTSKGQTTIPLSVRRSLGLAQHDRLAYELTAGKVTLRPLRGNFLRLRGSVPAAKKPEDFGAVRAKVRTAVASAAGKR